MRFPIFARSFVEAFVFREALDGAFLLDDATEDCDADVVDNAEEGGTGDNASVVDAMEAFNVDVVDAVDEKGFTLTITSVMLVVAMSTGGGIVTNAVDAFLFLANVDGGGDIEEGGIVNDSQVVSAGLPTGGIALRIVILFRRISGQK